MVSGAGGVALASRRAVLTWATEAGMASEHRGSRGAKHVRGCEGHCQGWAQPAWPVGTGAAVILASEDGQPWLAWLHKMLAVVHSHERSKEDGYLFTRKSYRDHVIICLIGVCNFLKKNSVNNIYIEKRD